MKITVLGCGALGQLWLAALFKQGHDVQGWLRVPQPGCQVNLADTINGSIFNKTLTANDPGFLADSDLLLVTLKAWQVSSAVHTLAAQLPTHCPVLLLHNGMGTLEELRTLPQPVLSGTTTHAAKHDGNIIIHVASGTTHIGPGNLASSRYRFLASTLHHALPDVVWHDNIVPANWNKLAINCVINPLTALYNCRNGELQQYQDEIIEICREVARVMEKEGCPASTQILYDYVTQLIDSTAENISSMLQDIRMQRHTEIDYITGYLLRRAQAHGIAVPVNARLYERIKCKENEYEHPGTGLSGTRN